MRLGEVFAVVSVLNLSFLADLGTRVFMADDTSEFEGGLEGDDAAAGRSAEFANKLKRAFEDSKAELQDSVLCRMKRGTELLEQCVLGPHYVAGTPSVVQEVLDGSLVDDSCLTHGAGWTKWSSVSKVAKAWPKLTPEWTKWLARMEHFFGQTWRDRGLYDSIKMAEQEIHMDQPLLAAALCFWSSATNTLNLPLGPMTITLLDMAVIFGFRPGGLVICASSQFPSDFRSSLRPKTHKSNKKSKDEAKKTQAEADAETKRLLNYKTFYTTHAVDEPVEATTRQPPSPHEHTAFLLYWLCKFVFCNRSAKCTFDAAGIAEALSSGEPLALGPFVLSKLYRNLRNVVNNDMSLEYGGPIWMFQVWIQTYFQKLRPTCHPFVSTLTLGRQIIPLGALSHSVDDCFKFFFTKEDLSENEFSVCYSRTCSPLITVDISKSWGREFSVDATMIWGSILISRDLNYGLKGGQGRYGVEVYLPNFTARQLGFIQSCPAFFLMSRNHFSSWRTQFTQVTQCSAVNDYYVEQCGKLERAGLSPRTPRAIATKPFRTWWLSFFRKRLGQDLATAQLAALRGLPDLLGSKRGKLLQLCPYFGFPWFALTLVLIRCCQQTRNK